MKSTATTNVSGGMLRANGFRADTPGTFEPSGGAVEIQTLANSYGLIDCTNGNYLYNLNVNYGGISGGAYLNANLLISHDLNILLGALWFKGYTATVLGSTSIYDGGFVMDQALDVLNAGNDPSDIIIWYGDASLEFLNLGRINIFGNCTIEAGVDYNIDTEQTFAFVGTGDQYLRNYDDATFGTIELAKPSGQLIIPTGSDVICESYDWTSGTFTLNGGSFIANDLADEGLFGTYNFNSGEAYFIQDEEQFPDINGTLNISGATVTIEGGEDACFWGYSDNTVFNMSGGEFNFLDNGVTIDERLGFTLTENITGGTIRTNGDFLVKRPEFTPLGGEIELFGSTQSNLETEDGYIYDLLVNKNETDQGMPLIKKRNGDNIPPVDATNARLTDNLMVNGTTTIESGMLETMGFDMTCSGNVEVNNGGTLVVHSLSQVSMGNTSDINVNSGGMLEVLAEAGSEAVFTHITGNYAININAEGTISAGHAIFEYLGSTGLNITLDASIDPANPLNNCTFRYGKAGGTLLIINNDQTLTIDGAEFYTNGTENFNVKKVVNVGEITFTNYGGDFAGQAFEEDPYNRIHWFEPAIQVTPSNHNVSAEAGTVTFEITSNTAWIITEAMDWLGVSPMTGNGNATVTVNYDENTTILSRIGSINISSPGFTSVNVTVTQSGVIPILEISPANRDVSALAGTTTFDLTSNTSWTVSESIDWLSVDPASGSNNEMLSVDYLENISGANRVGEITVEASGIPNIIITVTQESYTIHSISLEEGWTGLSSFVMPKNTDIEALFDGINSDLTIALTEENVFYPAYNINTIGTWQQHSAYKVKMSGAANLDIVGYPEENKTLALAEGWNLIPVISECPVDVEDIFAPIISDIEIVKDVAGLGIYWPAMGINTLGALNPGKAYYALTTADVEISFGDCAKSNGSGTLTVPKAFGETLSELSPWKMVNPTASSHSIVLFQDAIQNIENGSIIGTFDVEGNCFGLVPLDGKAGCLTIFGDDVLTAEKDGFVDGEQIYFKIFKPLNNEEFELIPEFDFALPSYNGKFVEHGLSAITGFKAVSTGTAGLSIENIRVYPNPSNGTFNITGVQAGAEITITDIHGQLVFSGRFGLNDKLQIDLQKCNPGIYMVEIMLNGNTSFHKLILK